jgi:adenine-specific DNA-methyltransferase
VAELIWNGKYREGERVAPVRVVLPLQTVETFGARHRARSLDVPAPGNSADWYNRLIWGDTKYVLSSLLPEFARKVNLIYIDPPFDTGTDFSYATGIPEGAPDLVNEPSKIEAKAYRDTWGISVDERRRGIGSLDKYLAWFYETAIVLRELLADDGSLYVHLDENVGHYAKVILDELFGQGCFQREIVWRIGWISGYKSKARNWIRNHDVILFYVKDKSRFAFNKEYIPYPAGYTRRDGSPPSGAGYPIDDVWNASEVDRMDSIQIMSFSGEKVGYPTQKNENLVSRIVRASSNEGDVVLDCFCGSGTAAVVAEKLKRRWIACDLGRLAIHTTRKRLFAVSDVKPFVVQNLGKYERQAWMAAEFEKSEDRAATEAAYRKFVLELYRADPATGYARIHGAKDGRFVHVGSVDAPVTQADVKAIAREVRRAAGRANDGVMAGADVLGWEFALDRTETARLLASEERVDVRFKCIPRDALDKRAVEQHDIKSEDFFELRAFSTKASVDDRTATIELVDFTLPLDDMPQDARRTVKHWSQWVDSWAIDWNFKGDAFHNEWLSRRARPDPKLELLARHEYDEPATYTVVVRVTDLLGCDITKTLLLEVM